MNTVYPYQKLLQSEKDLRGLMRFRSEPVMIQRDSVALHQFRLQELLNLVTKSRSRQDLNFECPIEITFGYNLWNKSFHEKWGNISRPDEWLRKYNIWIFDPERKNFDLGYANEFLGVHDWIEVFTEFGDVPTHYKNSMNFNEKEELEKAELDEIETISNSTINSSNYDLEMTLLDAMFKQTLEAQSGSYLDKFDGFMSCANELLMGNYTFETPFTRYCDELFKFKKGKFPRLMPLLETGHFVFDVKGLISGEGDSFNKSYNLWREANSLAKVSFDKVYSFSLQ